MNELTSGGACSLVGLRGVGLEHLLLLLWVGLAHSHLTEHLIHWHWHHVRELTCRHLHSSRVELHLLLAIYTSVWHAVELRRKRVKHLLASCIILRRLAVLARLLEVHLHLLHFLEVLLEDRHADSVVSHLMQLLQLYQVATVR